MTVPDNWKSYVELDGGHVIVAANSPTTVAELLEHRGLHDAQIVQNAAGTEHHLIAELIREAWMLADFAARYELVPRVTELWNLVHGIRDALMEGGQNAQSRWRKAIQLLEQADMLRDDICRSPIRLQAADPSGRLSSPDSKTEWQWGARDRLGCVHSVGVENEAQARAMLSMTPVRRKVGPWIEVPREVPRD